LLLSPAPRQFEPESHFDHSVHSHRTAMTEAGAGMRSRIQD